MKVVEGCFRPLRRRLCAIGLLVALGAVLFGCGAPAASSAGYCDQNPNSNRC